MLRRLAGTLVMLFPSSRTSPLVGWSNPAMMRSAVVFPQPLGPSSDSSSPEPTLRSTESTATTSPNCLRSCRISRLAMVPLPRHSDGAPVAHPAADEEDAEHREPR